MARSMEILSILLYLFEGYCVQFFFSSFAEPKLHSMSGAQWAAAAAWIAVRIVSRILFADTHSITLPAKLIFSFAVLYIFCIVWYRGNMMLKVFLAIQFISLRELAFWAGYSFLYIGDRLIDFMISRAGSIVSIEDLPVAADVLSCIFVALTQTVQGVLLFLSIKKMAVSDRRKEKGRMDQEVIFYLLPAVTGVLVAVLVRLLMITAADGVPVLLYEKYPVLYLVIPMIAFVLLLSIVCGFCIYQDMSVLQEERAEKMILENQMIQMQNSMMEMEHLYDGVRAVKHDMKNNMSVLYALMQNKNNISFTGSMHTSDVVHYDGCTRPLDEGGQEDEILHYFEGMYQAVEQLDSRLYTGNAVSDAVVSSKFRYAEKLVKGIRLDAGHFMLSDAAVKAYDLGIILNNGLDNAIEACVRMREKQPEADAYIKIRSFKAKNMFFIEIENSFDGTLLLHKDSGDPISTKQNKEMHGIGLKNIRNCAAKYGGDLDCIVEGSKFILSVMLKS